MPEIDPVLSKMMFQRVFRSFLLLIGLAVLLVGGGLIQSRRQVEQIEGGLIALIGLGLMVLPLLPAFKEAIEMD